MRLQFQSATTFVPRLCRHQRQLLLGKLYGAWLCDSYQRLHLTLPTVFSTPAMCLSLLLVLYPSAALSFSFCFLYKYFYCCCCCFRADILTCEVRHTHSHSHTHNETRACIMAAVKTAANCFFYSSQICIKRKTCASACVIYICLYAYEYIKRTARKHKLHSRTHTHTLGKEGKGGVDTHTRRHT